MKGIRYSPIASEGLENIFYCWTRVVSSVKGFEEEFRVCRPSDFWLYSDREKRYTEFVSKYVKPSGHITVSLRSKELFSWGVFEVFAKLPRFEKGPMFWFGFELDDLFGGGVVHFMWHSGEGVLKAFAGGFSSRVEMDLTKYLPVDASDRKHLYRIVYRRGLAMWFIDNRLRAMAIIGVGDVRDSGILYNGDPYVIGFTRDAPSSALPVLLDIDGGDVEKSFEWQDLHPWDLRVSNGDSETPIVIDLYKHGEDKKLVDALIDKEVVSAPIPGTLRHKEITFVADNECRLAIEAFVNGNWFGVVEADIDPKKIHNIIIENMGILYRLVIKPRKVLRVIEAKAFLQ